MKIAERFTSRWSVCWATTYTLDPAFFEAFLLRRLGEPPLNVVLLVDFERLAHLWHHIGDDERHWVRRANRDYLLRGIRPTQGAFHAKTILLGNQRSGQLFVGSGNIGLTGIETGREVYSAFDSGVEGDLRAFAEWREWMAGLVKSEGDADLRIRWSDLMARMPWLSEAQGPAPMRTNRQRPIVEQLLQGIEPPVDELHVTAPFYDAGLDALETLIERTQPRHLRVYLGNHTSVDGEALAGVLRRRPDANAMCWTPATYVHAKIAAVIQGDTARVTAGSANLSHAALLSTVSAPGANVEANVVVDLSAPNARALFEITNLKLEPIGLDALGALRLATMVPTLSFAYRLHSAAREADGRLRLRTDPELPAQGTVLTDGIHLAAVGAGQAAEWRSLEDVAIVWIEDEQGVPLSNRVALEDRASLERMLSTRSHDWEHPSGIEDRDLGHPLGELLADLHRHAVFDIDDTPAAHRVAELEASNDQSDADFWDRYLRGELQLDPRYPLYGRSSRPAGTPMESELSWLLSQMLARVPVRQQIHMLSGELRTAAEREGRSWTPDQRLQVRAYNVLQRWSQALADPRSRWIGEFAPGFHYGALLGAIIEIWTQLTWIPLHRLPGLAHTLFAAFIRSERSPGYLYSIPEDERVASVGAVRSLGWQGHAAALAYCALRDAKPADFFAWQAFLVPGLEWGIFEVTGLTVAVVEALHGTTMRPGVVADRLLAVATYTDDEHWAGRVAADLDLPSVTLGRLDHPVYRYELVVDANLDLLRDPRVVILAREALDYTKSSGVRVNFSTGIATFAYGDAVYARQSDGRSAESPSPLSRDELLRREALGQGLDGLLASSRDAVA